MKCIIRFIFAFTIAYGSPLALLAQTDAVSTALPKPGASLMEVPETRRFENPLFTSEDVLHFKLLFDYQELQKDRGDERGIIRQP